MFARLMKALAVSHEAWAGDPDPQLAHQAMQEMGSVSDEVLLMQSLVHAWNGDKLEALRIAVALAKRNTSWVMRQRIIWIYLVCGELDKAQVVCKSWMKDHEEGGSIREMNSDRRAIEIVAQWPDSSRIDKESMSSQHRLHAEFIFGLIALAQSDEDSALLQFERAIGAHDDWEVTRYANAIHTRLSKDLARQKRTSTTVRPKGLLSVADDE